ncbi:MAG: DUF1566 domain-containing protein [candidate division KSB1 bacterium]
MEFRSQPLNRLSEDEWAALLRQKLFFEWRWRKRRLDSYEQVKHGKEKLVFDKATGLTWQQSGSLEALSYSDAQNYLRALNQQRFAKYQGWRLPTLDEAMSLLEPFKYANGMYIDPRFDAAQKWIWTNDEAREGVAWAVTFRSGCCYVPVEASYFVRAVRGELWFPEGDSSDELLVELL